MPPPPDVSVIMAAYHAQATVVEAAASALTGQGVSVELAIASDDGVDYRALLEHAGLPVAQVIQVRTPTVRSGAAVARNTVLPLTGAPIIAALDADDAYAPGRLRRVLDKMAHDGVGAGTGPTVERVRGGAASRVAEPRSGGGLTLADICELRMPFSPVFQRDLAPGGWPEVGFAEDMVLNAALHGAAGGYAFAEDAAYHYHIEAGSLVQGPDSLRAALSGYAEILRWLETGDIAADPAQAVRRVIEQDIATARAALASGRGSWRDAFRDG